MKKIQLENYIIEILSTDGQKKGDAFKVRESMVNILLHPSLMLNGRELMNAHKLASKIEDTTEDFILLESDEYKRLITALDTIKGFGKNECEFVRRIYDAEDVDVQEKK